MHVYLNFFRRGRRPARHKSLDEQVPLLVRLEGYTKAAELTVLGMAIRRNLHALGKVVATFTVMHAMAAAGENVHFPRNKEVLQYSKKTKKTKGQELTKKTKGQKHKQKKKHKL
jgi:hypothetical protein